MKLNDIINSKYDLADEAYRKTCRASLRSDGVLHITDFLNAEVLQKILTEAKSKQDKAYYCVDSHNVYLTASDESLSESHAYNRQVSSSKGGLADDEISSDSALRFLYNDADFKDFLVDVLEESYLFPYADSLSSINVHYAAEGQELGWHFDNSSFAITLLLQKPESGGEFQYVKDVRYLQDGLDNFDGISDILDGRIQPVTLPMQAGSLVLFRGRNSLHRVAPSLGGVPRIIVVFAYNSAPDVALSEKARMMFYGRVE